MDIKLKDFEGPLDLLLHLVSKYQMDIYDVPIVDVIEQYLVYLETLQAMRLEVAGEYMVMASQLVLIKSRRLLPKVAALDPEDPEDPELALLNQLEEYSRFKEISQDMEKQHEKRASYYGKVKEEIIFEEASLRHDKSTMDLFLAFSKIMAERQEVFKANHTVIERDDYRIEDMMTRLSQRLHRQPRLVLNQVFEECQNISEVITLFLATLELIKVQEATVEQTDHFSQIILRKVAA